MTQKKSSNLDHEGGNLARNWLGFMAIGCITHYSLPVTLIPSLCRGRRKQVKREGRKEQRSREGHRKSKHGNLGLERNRVTVSPSLWVWRSEEKRRTRSWFLVRTQTWVIAAAGKMEIWTWLDWVCLKAQISCGRGQEDCSVRNLKMQANTGPDPS